MTVDRGNTGSFAKFKNSVDMAMGLIDNFCFTAVSMATASGSNMLSVIKCLRAGSDVVARRRTNGLNKTTVTSLDNYAENTSNYHGYLFKL